MLASEYDSSAMWSRRGDSIAFVRNIAGGFLVARNRGSDERVTNSRNLHGRWD